MRWRLALLMLLAGVAVTVSTLWSSSGLGHDLALQFGPSMVTMALGVVAINIYLEGEDKKGAVRSILRYSYGSIANFHNTFMEAMWTRFGKEDFNRLVHAYRQGEYDPLMIPPGDRAKIYAAAQACQPGLGEEIERLDRVLADMVTVVGWDLSADLVDEIFRARTAIQDYRQVTTDGTDAAVSGVTEHLLDLLINVNMVDDDLQRIGKVKPERA